MKINKNISCFISACLIFNMLSFTISSGNNLEDERYKNFSGKHVEINELLENKPLDVEIEGSSVVNLYKNDTLDDSNSRITIKNNGFEFKVTDSTIPNNWLYIEYEKPYIKDNTTYTFILNIKKNTFPKENKVLRIFKPESTDGKSNLL